MILPSPKDALHRGQMYRVLTAIADSSFLSRSLIFKGGTCAAMQGCLDRFSVDLDFDLAPGISKDEVKKIWGVSLSGWVLRLKAKVYIRFNMCLNTHLLRITEIP